MLDGKGVTEATRMLLQAATLAGRTTAAPPLIVDIPGMAAAESAQVAAQARAAAITWAEAPVQDLPDRRIPLVAEVR
jgi:hypothetical protein